MLSISQQKENKIEIPDVMLFKFRCLKYGLRALHERKLKIATLDSLNDPFEAMPFNATNSRVRGFLMHMKKEIGTQRGVLSFSWRWSNPVLWSHYADAHRGVCLGFGVPVVDSMNHNIFPVRYISRPLKLDSSFGWDQENAKINLDDEEQMENFAHALFFTKYTHWKYENEVRMLMDLGNKEGEHYFCPFCEDLKLWQVIVGAHCEVSPRELRLAMEGCDNAENIIVTFTKLSYREFKVIEDFSVPLSEI